MYLQFELVSSRTGNFDSSACCHDQMFVLVNGDGDHVYNDDDLGVKEGGQAGAGKRPNCTSREAACTLQSPLLCISIFYLVFSTLKHPETDRKEKIEN